MNRFQRFGMISAMALGLAAPAFACSIMPPPPPPVPAPGTSQADADALSMAWGKAHGLKYAAENRDWAMKQQARFFDEADTLMVVRYVRADKTDDDTFAILKPIRWLKGSGAPAELRIGSTMPPPCGQMIGHDAYYGQPGDVFLVYLSGGRQPGVMEAYSLDRIIEPRTIEALTKMPE